jgi:alkanesulfonate monooxygenase SsuD/methylene tetrahydromethanopterin reductase-like flavin-dependent oxidoreductase (luciferase family)
VSTVTQRGFGVPGTCSFELVHVLAPAAETAGYASFWSNDTPAGEGLALLQAAAEHTTSIRLGVGVLPLDRWTPQRITARLAELGLPAERLTLGIGAGAGGGGLKRVRDGVAALRESQTASIVVGALGPRMRRLAGELADGVILDWVTPPAARAAAADVQRAARAAGRPRPSILAYVFTALGDPARAQLRTEAHHYGSVPAYAAHFQRIGAAPSEAAVAAQDPDSLNDALAAFDDTLNETVVRAVTNQTTVSAYLELLVAASPA